MRTLRGAGVAVAGASFCFFRLDLAVAAWTRHPEIANEPTRCERHFVDGAIEDFFVRARRPARAAQLADELNCRGADLLIRGRRLEVRECLDASAHTGRGSVQLSDRSDAVNGANIAERLGRERRHARGMIRRHDDDVLGEPARQPFSDHINQL
jgi:hypothetical protein